eukprot:576167-Alexandrium_andersonii.AAC.1
MCLKRLLIRCVEDARFGAEIGKSLAEDAARLEDYLSKIKQLIMGRQTADLEATLTDARQFAKGDPVDN